MKTHVILLFTLLLTAGCKKEKSELEKLPAATQSGANTAGCLVNGKVFVATGWGSGMGKVPGINVAIAYDSIYWLNLNSEHSGQRATISLFLNNLKATGIYPLQVTTPILPTAGPEQCANYMAYVPDGYAGDTYVTNTRQMGQVTITAFDYNRHVVAGTFEFTAGNLTTPGKTIRVTNGRFDTRHL